MLMSLLIISSTCLSILFLMPQMLQPLSLGLSIMALSSFLAVISSFFISSWYSYVLFLIFVGSLLVMFAYIAVLAPNTFFVSTKPLVTFAIMFFFTLIVLNQTLVKSSHSLTHPSNNPSFYLETGKAGSELVSLNSTSIIVILGTLLLFILLAVVKICYFQQGPLRAFLKQPDSSYA